MPVSSDYVDGMWKQIGRLNEEVEKLKAENAHLRENSERYRWLRDCCPLETFESIIASYPNRRDEAIDKARQKLKEIG